MHTIPFICSMTFVAPLNPGRLPMEAVTVFISYVSGTGMPLDHS